jgi:PAS domain S-box-containing protein
MLNPADAADAFPPPFWRAHPTRWLAAIVESSDDAIIGKTLDSVIRSWNRGAERIFGYRADEIIGRSILVLIPPELHHQEREIIDKLSRNERVTFYETARVRKDGRRIEISLTASPILDDMGHVIGASKIARDVTEAMRLQRAERQLAEQLQEQAVELEQQIEEAQTLRDELEQRNDQLQRALEETREARAAAERANRVKSEFLATMSHELRTPLNAIGGYVDLLDLGIHGPLTDDQRADLTRIKWNQRVLLRHIEDVLGLAKLEAGRLQLHLARIPIDEVLRNLEAFIAPALRSKGLQYHFEPCGPDALAYADPHKVEQIMVNLLSNAAKFTDSGRVDVRCLTHDDVVEIEVRDTGRGIAPTMRECIFEPFVQVDQELTHTAEGTGLGLAISRQLAREMGGDVTVDSELGTGSRFRLRLPRAGTDR